MQFQTKATANRKLALLPSRTDQLGETIRKIAPAHQILRKPRLLRLIRRKFNQPPPGLLGYPPDETPAAVAVAAVVDEGAGDASKRSRRHSLPLRSRERSP